MKRVNGQALVEFAVMGSLALLALAFMIQIGLRMNYQQELDQQTFRQAMAQAQSEGVNAAAADRVQHFRDRLVPNPAQGFATMVRTPIQASATATGGAHLTRLDGDRDSQPRLTVDLNGVTQELRSGDLPQDQPMVSHMHKELASSGIVTQAKTAEGASPTSRLQSTTTETSTLTLSNGATLSSSLNSTCHFEDNIWTCSR